MQRRTAVRAATSLAAVSALVLGCLLAAPTADAQTPRKAVPSTKPTWRGDASHLGAASTHAAMNLRVYLAPRGGLDNLKAAATAVSTPGSATYRHFISPSAYKALYAPTNATVQSVESWLTASGLKVTAVEDSHRYVSVTGTVAAAQKAFGVSLQRYQHDGQSVTAPSRAATIPANLAPTVLAVSGAGHHRPQGRAHLGPGGTTAGRLRERTAVLAFLRSDPGEVQSRFPDTTPDLQRQGASVCAVRLHRLAVSRGVQGDTTWTARASRWRSPTHTRHRRSPRTPRLCRHTATRGTPPASSAR